MTHERCLPSLILIGGPTASGKSALALEMAERVNGTIINADAMQVYAGVPILTAQPIIPNSNIPHTLYGCIDPAEAFSVGKWLPLANATIANCVEEGRTPIVVGGTGMYFMALTDGLAAIPAIPNEVRQQTEAFYEDAGTDAFRAALAKIDRESAERIMPNDKQRLIRAYEVATHTGKTIHAWQKNDNGIGVENQFKVERHVVMPPRDKLYASCDKRFAAMINNGALDEVRALAARRLPDNLPSMKILGVRELMAFLRDETTLPEAIVKAQQVTRNYAKRQMTWFRNQWKAYSSVDFP